MKLLLTGATGYTGRGVAGVLAKKHWVRGLDVAERPAPVNELVVGDLADLEVCRRALEGVEAMVLCHMAPNPVAYTAPPAGFDANVKGTANLYHAAHERGIRRAVLLSSISVLPKEEFGGHNTGTGTLQGADGLYCVPRTPGDGPYNFANGLYALTKLMQEIVARHYFDSCGIATAIFRPAWIVYDEELINKYGQRVEKYSTHLIDPRDLGRAFLEALDLADLKLEAFNIGQDDLPWDQAAIRARLHWRPEYRFASLPR